MRVKHFLTRLPCLMLLVQCGLVGTLQYHKISTSFPLNVTLLSILYISLSSQLSRFQHLFTIHNFFFLHSQMSNITIKLSKFNFVYVTFLLSTTHVFSFLIYLYSLFMNATQSLGTAVKFTLFLTIILSYLLCFASVMSLSAFSFPLHLRQTTPPSDPKTSSTPLPLSSHSHWGADLLTQSQRKLNQVRT